MGNYNIKGKSLPKINDVALPTKTIERAQTMKQEKSLQISTLPQLQVRFSQPQPKEPVVDRIEKQTKLTKLPSEVRDLDDGLDQEQDLIWHSNDDNPKFVRIQHKPKKTKLRMYLKVVLYPFILRKYLQRKILYRYV